MSVSVQRKHALSIPALSAAAAILAYAPVGQAFNFGDMMNPNRWFGGGDRYNDRYDDPYWGGGPYGPGPYSGYGYPGVYGTPYGLPYGAPGFVVPPAGYGTAAPPAPTTTPAQSTPTQSRVDPGEVEALKRRIEALESRQKQDQPKPQTSEWPAPSSFRPMNQY